MPIVQYIFGQYHPKLGYTLQPNIKNAHLEYKNYLNYSFSTNSNGFRGEEWDLNEERKNIVVLGDSFAFGWGVEDDQVFSKLLENNLRKQDANFQVINLAQSGYFLDQIINTFDLYKDKLNPLVIIYAYCYNDTFEHPPEEDNSFDISNFRKNISQKEFSRTAMLNNVRIWRLERWYKSLYLYGFFHNYIIPGLSNEKSKISRISRRHRYVFNFKGLSPAKPPQARIPLDTTQKRYLWECLTKLHSLAQNSKIILIDTSNKILIHYPDNSNSDRWILRDFANLHDNVFFTDFESAVRNKNDGTQLFLNIDDHWSAEGHEFISNLLLKTL